jgi:hypothetical protein
MKPYGSPHYKNILPLAVLITGVPLGTEVFK